MNKLTRCGQLMFAIGIIALGILCIISKDFIAGRPPAWPGNVHVNPVLAYVSGVALIIAALAIILNRNAALAALLIAILILLLSVLRHLPHFMEDWGNSYKSMALFGGALIIASSFYQQKNNITAGFNIHKRLREIFVITGCILLAAFFICSGYAHFKFADFVINFIPAYIPFRTFWTYFCAICLLAGAIGLVIPQTRRVAALLSGIMILGWFILLHIPRFIANTNDASDRMGLCESFTLVGILFVLAGIHSARNKFSALQSNPLNTKSVSSVI